MSKSSKKRNREKRRKRLAAERSNGEVTPLAETSGNGKSPSNFALVRGDTNTSTNGLELPTSEVTEPQRFNQVASNKPKASTSFVPSVPTPDVMSVDGTVFGSRKRKLARINFVKPTVNGISELFSFGQLVDANHAKDKEVADRLETDGHDQSNLQTPNRSKSSQHIDEILYPKSAPELHSKSDSSNDVERSKANGVRGNYVAKPKDDEINKTTMYIEATKVSLEKNVSLQSNRPNERSPTDLKQAQKAAFPTNHNHGHISGVSVEEAVRDSIGLRPRANSTDDELKLPQRGLCDERKVLEAYRWNFDIQALPKGFRNLGNTCFLNSTLQCLVYLPPFCQSLMELREVRLGTKADNGIKEKLIHGKRITHILRSLFRRVHGDRDCNAISPNALVKAVPTLGSNSSVIGYKFRPGRQEDAHEFLVHLLDAMHDGELQDAGINPRKSGWRDRLPVPRLDETTFVHRIFGGYLRSQVRCTSCGYCSNTYDPFLDLSLEISRKSCTSVVDAIQQFTRKETLDSDNRWKCSGCKTRVCASKQLTVFRPPLSLCIQLKRFSYRGRYLVGGSYSFFGNMGGGGTKITKPIEFPAGLKLPLSDGRSCGYSLSGIVIHVGGSASSGHYTACVKRPCKKESYQWFYMDDSDASPVSEKAVLRQKDAYLLFYSREEVKLEFPPPPRRASMSAEEAQELGRARARAKSVMPVEERQGKQATRGDPIASSDAAHVTKNKLGTCSKNSVPPRPLTTSESAQFPKTEPEMNNDTSLLLRTGANAESVPSNCNENVTLDKTSDTKSGAHDLKSSSSTESKAIANSQNVSSLATKKIDVSPCNSALILLKETVAQQENTSHQSIIETQDSHHKSMNHLNKDTPGGSNTQQNNKEKKLASLQRDGRKIEVMMGPRFKSKSSAWKPKALPCSRDEAFGLLGNLPVSKWDDGSDGGKDEQGESSKLEDRSKILDELEKKEKITKRRMHLDRWDGFLDQGKTKKVKKNNTAKTPSSNQENAFQRFQSSLQKMKKGRPNEHFRAEKVQKQRS